MIEPLRYTPESGAPYAIDKAVFCTRCLSAKKTRNNPGLAVKFCGECAKYQLLCETCDDYVHNFVKARLHRRLIIVVGPAVRKKIIRRGDSRSFPQLFDEVEVKFKGKIYHSGKLIHEEPLQFLKYPAGVSGSCVHVQILGGKNLPIADSHGSSDPFVVVNFGGHVIGRTRTRHRTINPRWNNETFVVPVDEKMYKKRSSRSELLKIEVYDRDYFNMNDFLGHVELTRTQLYELAKASKQRAIRLNLTTREYHGNLSVQCGMIGGIFQLKICEGYSLDSMDAIGLSDPFCEVYFAGRYIGKTPVEDDTLDPVWTKGNIFSVRITDILNEEKRLLSLLNIRARNFRFEKAKNGEANNNLRNRRVGVINNINVENKAAESNKLDGDYEVSNLASLFRIELYDHNLFTSKRHMGTVRIPVLQLRKLLPDLPKSESRIDKGNFRLRQQLRLLPVYTYTSESRNITGRLRKLSLASVFNNSDSNREEEDEKEDEELIDEDVLREDMEDITGDDLGGGASIENGTLKRKGTKLMSHLVEENEEGENSDDNEDWLEPPSPKMPSLMFEDSVNESQPNNGLSDESYKHGLSFAEANKKGDVEKALELRRLAFLKQANLPVMAGVSEGLQGAEELQGNGMDETGANKEEMLPRSTMMKGENNGREDVKSNTLRMEIGNREHLEGVDKDNNTNKQRGNYDGGEEVQEVNETGEGGDDGSNDNIDDASYLKPSRLKHMDLENDSEDDDEEGEWEGEGEEEDEDDEEAPLLEKSSLDGESLFPSLTNTTSEFAEEPTDLPEIAPSMTLQEKISELKNALFATLSSLKPIVASSVPSGDVSVKSIESENITKWGEVVKYTVTKESTKNVAGEELSNRGQLIVRLLLSTRGHVIRGLDVGVQHMTLGETSTIKVRYDYGYGNFWMGTHLPPRSTLVFTVKLLSINGSGNIEEMPWRQLLRFTRMLRRRFKWTYEHTVATLQYMYRGVVFLCNKLMKKREVVVSEDETSEEEEESIQISVSSCSSSESDDDSVLQNPAAVAGMGVLLGYNRSKRPVKVKRVHRTKEEKMRDKIRQKRIALGLDPDPTPLSTSRSGSVSNNGNDMKMPKRQDSFLGIIDEVDNDVQYESSNITFEADAFEEGNMYDGAENADRFMNDGESEQDVIAKRRQSEATLVMQRRKKDR